MQVAKLQQPPEDTQQVVQPEVVWLLRRKDSCLQVAKLQQALKDKQQIVQQAEQAQQSSQQQHQQMQKQLKKLQDSQQQLQGQLQSALKGRASTQGELDVIASKVQTLQACYNVYMSYLSSTTLHPRLAADLTQMIITGRVASDDPALV